VQEMLTGTASFAGTIMADKIAGMTALYATTMALFHRERTGEGQEVEVSMFETMAAFMLVEHANGAMFTPPLGPAVYPRTVSPNRRPHKTKDGHIAALIYNDKQWAAFVAAVRPPWALDGRYDKLEDRAADINNVYGLLGQTFGARTTAEWLGLFHELGIPAAPLNTPGDLFDDPHLNAIGFFETIETHNGPVRFPGVPTWFSRTPAKVAGPTPRLGEGSEEILAELAAARPKAAKA
jgi:crotonobetainyl-CoA:carnitine CoA-transferase CaiB-like acyl-CoA transferase